MINKQTFKFSSYNNNIQLINPNLENNDKQEKDCLYDLLVLS